MTRIDLSLATDKLTCIAHYLSFRQRVSMTNRTHLYWRRCWAWYKRWWGPRRRWWRRPGWGRGRRRWGHAHSPPQSQTGTIGRRPRPGTGISWLSRRRRPSRRLHSSPSTSWIPGIISNRKIKNYRLFCSFY